MKIPDKNSDKNEWRWSKFQKYLLYKLNQYSCKELKIPSKFAYKESSYGSKNNIKNVILSTWAGQNKRINFCRSVCIDSPSYSVLNFLIIPSTKYNMPFFGVDFVSLPKFHLIVLDFQPSLNIEEQFEQRLLNHLLNLKNNFHQNIPIAEEMSKEIATFFSPGVIWSKLIKEKISDQIIEKSLYPTFKKYLNLYLKVLDKEQPVDSGLTEKLIKGQNNYLNFRKLNDPARPMLKVLFGESFTESFINNLLFEVN